MRVSSSDRAVPASKSGSSQSDGWSRQRGVDENADQASSSSSSTPAGSGSGSPRIAGTSPVPGSVQCGSSTPRAGVTTVGVSAAGGRNVDGASGSGSTPQSSSSTGHDSGSADQASVSADQASGSSGGAVVRPSRYASSSSSSAVGVPTIGGLATDDGSEPGIGKRSGG